MLAKGFHSSGKDQVDVTLECMHNRPFDIEDKYDGERQMLHYKGRQVMLWTRNGNDYTNEYYPLASTVAKESKKCGVGSAIFDGEVLAYDKKTDRHVVFGKNRTIGKLERERALDPSWDPANDTLDHNTWGPPDRFETVKDDWRSDLDGWLQYVVFDVVFLSDEFGVQGRCAEIIAQSALEIEQELGIVCPAPLPQGGCIVHLPLAIRKRILAKMIPVPIPNVVEPITFRRVTSTDTKERQECLIEEFDKANLADREGLLVKDLTSPYLTTHGKRADFWVKMKPDYSGIKQDFDVVVVGFRDSEGSSFRSRSSLGIGAMLCAIKEETEDGQVKFVSFCMVGSGISSDIIKEIEHRFKDKIVNVDNFDKIPSHPNCNLKDMFAKLPPHIRPTRYILPQDSFPVEIKGAELCASTLFSFGSTLRFPRIVRLRLDKNFDDILSTLQITQIMNAPSRTWRQIHTLLRFLLSFVSFRRRLVSARSCCSALRACLFCHWNRQDVHLLRLRRFSGAGPIQL